ncbi:MAG: hypothetical protein ACREKK_14015 [Candidatus Methylomirabilales bacterium]
MERALGVVLLWLGFLTGTGAQGRGTGQVYDAVLLRSLLEELWRAPYLAVEPVAGVEAPADSMGLSFFTLWRHGARFEGHTGSQAGFRSFIYLSPSGRGAVVAAFNISNAANWERSSAGFRAVRDQALRLIVPP